MLIASWPFLFYNSIKEINKMTIKPAEFSTRDIYLATVIKLSGIPILRIENHSGRGIFIFAGTPKIAKITQEYFNGKIKLEVRSVFDTWKSLKSMAFSATENLR